MRSEIQILKAGVAASHSRIKIARSLPGRTPIAIAGKAAELRPWRMRPRELEEPSAPFSFRLSHEAHGWLTRIARQKRTTRSEILRRIVAAARSGALPF